VSSLPASSPEPTAARKALTAVVLAAVLLAAVVVQLTVVNRLPLPGGAVPDLVLLLVTAIAVCTSPLAGALAGFAGGLALDVAPPSIHYAGEYALVFCLAGWGAGRVNRAIADVRGERDQMVTFAVMAGAAAAGEAGKAALGMMLSDPDVTAAVASRLLPTAVLYDLLVAPFAFWLVARVTRGADPERAPAPEFSVEQRLAFVFRSASVGAAAGLRLAGSGANYLQPPAAGRVPRLRLSDARARSSTNPSAGPGGARTRPGARTPRLSFGGDLAASTGSARTGQPRTGPGASRAHSKNWLRGASGIALAGSPALKAQTAAAARRAARRPGTGWLSAAGSAGLAAPSARRASRLPGRGWLSAAGSAGLAAPSARRASRLPGKGWITAETLAPPSAQRESRTPGKGWLAAADPADRATPSAPRASRLLGQGWITRRRTGPSERRVSRLPGKGWIIAGRLARPAGPRAARGPGRGWLSAPRPGGGGLAGPGGPRSAADALAARSAPSGVSALSGGGTPMAARGSRGARAIRASAFRAPAFHGRRAYRGNRYTAAPSGEWLRHGRHPWRKRGYLPGGRPPGSPGARPMAKSAIVAAARRLGFFGGRR
jgi:rod shape-determining protein MreD